MRPAKLGRAFQGASRCFSGIFRPKSVQSLSAAAFQTLARSVPQAQAKSESLFQSCSLQPKARAIAASIAAGASKAAQAGEEVVLAGGLRVAFAPFVQC